MLHLEAPESRTSSGLPHPVAQSAPNKLGTPHGQGFSDSLLEEEKLFALFSRVHRSHGRAPSVSGNTTVSPLRKTVSSIV